MSKLLKALEVSKLPHKEWQYLGMKDDGTKNHTCEVCSQKHIRFIHIIKHKEFEKKYNVGCNCAGYLIGDDKFPFIEESKYKNRLRIWFYQKWQKTKTNELYLLYENCEFWITKDIFGEIKISRERRHDAEKKTSASVFKNISEAKFKIFQYIEDARSKGKWNIQNNATKKNNDLKNVGGS